MSKKTETDMLDAVQNDSTVLVSALPEKKATSKKTLVYDESGERTLSKSEVRAMTGIVSRQDAFTIDPRIIFVDEDTNPRKFYGNDEEWQEHVDSIRSVGVREAVQVYVREDKSGKKVFHLAQGFRRMRAVMQIIAENPEAIASIPVTVTDGNRERMLLDHLVLNGSKELSEIEKAGIVSQLSVWGYEPKDIAEMAKYTEAKVRRYIDFYGGASKLVINAVIDNKMSISTGIELVKNTPDTLEQNKKLIKATEVAQSKAKPAPVAKKPKAEAKYAPRISNDFNDEDEPMFNQDGELTNTQAVPLPVAAPILKVKVHSSDFQDSSVSKKISSSLESKVSSLMNIVDKESMQFPDDIDMVFVDRVKEMFKMLNRSSSNHEIMIACFKSDN